MKNRSIGLLVLIFFAAALRAQPDSPKREFRGVWVATVSNIDFPRAPTPEAIAHKEQWKKLLERYKEIGLNAVIVQVRPAADAFYPSALAPWSKYLTGKQGTPPQPDYDPLKFMIEEAHRQGFEFHAWLNPYRATTDTDTMSLSKDHAFYKHRDWMVKYGDRFYFNPALPAVRQHLRDIVLEVVTKYDVDAIHFDDYFYPYKIRGEVFPDSTDFWRYGNRFNNIDDWRRSNVDSLIETVSTTIKEIKPYVKFGVSPFGVWRNRDKDPANGSDTRASQTCYDDLYADVLKWVRLGWLDYVAPQLYWNIGFPPADHQILLNWWSTRVQEVELYIGHAAYKVANNQEPAWHDANEIPKQIELNRRNFKSAGSIYFSSKSLLENRLGVRDTLDVYYQRPALLPSPATVLEKTNQAPVLRALKVKDSDVRVRWKPNKVDKASPAAYYVVYRFLGTKTENFNWEDPENIIHITPFFDKKKKFEFVDTRAEEGITQQYAVVAVNRQHVESKPSTLRAIKFGKLKELTAQ